MDSPPFSFIGFTTRLCVFFISVCFLHICAFSSYLCVFFMQGCYSAMVDYFETYIYTAGALAIVVLTIEVRTVFSLLLY